MRWILLWYVYILYEWGSKRCRPIFWIKTIRTTSRAECVCVDVFFWGSLNIGQTLHIKSTDNYSTYSISLSLFLFVSVTLSVCLYVCCFRGGGWMSGCIFMCLYLCSRFDLCMFRFVCWGGFLWGRCALFVWSILRVDDTILFQATLNNDNSTFWCSSRTVSCVVCAV